LLTFDPTADVAAPKGAARSRGVPLTVLDLERPNLASYDGCGLVLSRPDRHVSWWRNRFGLIDCVRGAAR
jgi:hypothetical protein